MSRHVIPTDPTRNREVVVGWDAPLGTFFGQVYVTGVPDDEEELLAWVGYMPREVTTVSELDAWVREQGFTIPQDTAARLIDESREPWEPGPLQRRLGFTGKEGDDAGA